MTDSNVEAFAPVKTHPSWEASKTEDNPWPRGWHRAPERPLRCVVDGHRILAEEDLWCTGRAGECYCKTHVHLAPNVVAMPRLPDLP